MCNLTNQPHIVIEIYSDTILPLYSAELLTNNLRISLNHPYDTYYNPRASMYACTKNKMYSDPNVRQFESSSTIVSSETYRRSLGRRAQP